MKELVIGVSEGKISRDPDTVLVTYALGSCVAFMLYDPVARVAGMAHYLLPQTSETEALLNTRPYKFADSAIPSLLRAALMQGADLRRLIVFAAGGAQVMSNNSMFNIGKRNCLALRKALWKFGLVTHAEDIGGTVIRTVRLDVGSGRVLLQSSSGKQWEMTGRRGQSATLTEEPVWH